MKKYIAIGIIFSATLISIGCTASTDNTEEKNTESLSENFTENKTKQIENTTEQSSNTFEASEEATAIILPIYEGYSTAIKQHEMEFSLTDVSISDYEDSNFYSFSLEYEGATPTSTPDVQFQEYKGIIKKSFEVDLPENCNNAILKDIITCTILAVKPELPFSEAETYMKQLVNSFDNYNQSDVVTVGNYRLFIKPKSSTLTAPSLEIVSLEDVNNEVDTSKYENYTSEEMQAPLNEGEKVHLSGKIQGIYECDYTNSMEVTSGDETYLIHYTPEDFPGCFSEGQEYEFYGEIANSRDGYAGCLRLDYFRKL